MKKELTQEIEIELARTLQTKSERRKATLRLRNKYKDDSIVIYSKKHNEDRKEPISKKESRELSSSNILGSELF